jgi:hypothetical protein
VSLLRSPRSHTANTHKQQALSSYRIRIISLTLPSFFFFPLIRSYHPTMSHPSNNNAQLEAVATMLNELARMLRFLKLSKATAPPPALASLSPAASSPTAGLQVGQRVLIICQGEYKGRTGTIMELHGTMFWTVHLKATAKIAGSTRSRQACNFSIPDHTSPLSTRLFLMPECLRGCFL